MLSKFPQSGEQPFMRYHRKQILIVVAVVILVLAISLSSFFYLDSQTPYKGKMETVTLGIYASEYSSLIYIANDQGFFSNNGIKLDLKNYTSGASAVKGILNGEVDIATASEFVVVNSAIKNESIYALGTVSKYLNLYLVARTDLGIHSISDLMGKRIGVALGSSNQFYLGRFLDLNGIKPNQVTHVNVNFVDTPNELANGTIDAAITFQPYIGQIQSTLGDKIVMWPAQADQFGYFEAICKQDWAISNPDLAARFLKSIVQAENFNIIHRDQAIAIVARDLNYTNSYVESVWPNYQFTVTLDQSFIVLMQDEARWLISNNLTNTTTTPNFTNYVYPDGLKSVKPDAVNIIG
jgi:ABC-type nitrate/sulfonate/bicarbonate transport system substrate-binding protein